mgnify:CR=1 FL=1
MAIDYIDGRDLHDIYDYRARPAGAQRLQVKGLRSARLPHGLSFGVQAGQCVADRKSVV